jgi:hypothetical protein
MEEKGEGMMDMVSIHGPHVLLYESFIFYFLVVLGLEPKASCILSKHSTDCFETGSHYVA